MLFVERKTNILYLYKCFIVVARIYAARAGLASAVLAQGDLSHIIINTYVLYVRAYQAMKRTPQQAHTHTHTDQQINTLNMHKYNTIITHFDLGLNCLLSVK